MFVSERKWKTKIFCESLVSVKENTDRKIKRREKERKRMRIEHKPN